MSIAEEYATALEAATILGVDRHTVARWVKEGKLTAEKVDREVLISRGQLAVVRKSPRGRKPKVAA